MLQTKLWSIELVVWCFAIFSGLLVVFPMYFEQIPYPFYIPNIVFVALLVIAIRILFAEKTWPLHRKQYVKGAGIFLMIPVLMYITEHVSSFKAYIDEIGIQELLSDLTAEKQEAMAKYIRNEMLFFGSAAFISVFLLPFKFFWSIWLQHNEQQ